MKKDIHPTYYRDAKTVCSCGATYEFGSAKKEMHVEICSACHPFYTGKSKLVDTAGRVERFKERAEKTRKIKEKQVARKESKAKPVAAKKRAPKKSAQKSSRTK